MTIELVGLNLDLSFSILVLFLFIKNFVYYLSLAYSNIKAVSRYFKRVTIRISLIVLAYGIII